MARGPPGGCLMSRPKSPDGHRHHVNIKLSDAEAAAIDAVRGNLERGPWMRHAALSVASRNPGIPEPKRGQKAAVPAPQPRFDPGSPPPQPKARPAAAQGNCPHPKARINKGLCGACGTYVGSKKVSS
jgi:hypothetical protein